MDIGNRMVSIRLTWEEYNDNIMIKEVLPIDG